MIDFSTQEKTLILEAIKHEKDLQNRSDDEEIEYIEEIEEEIGRNNVFLSRRQLDTIGTYLGPLMDTGKFKQLEISALEDKISELTDLD